MTDQDQHDFDEFDTLVDDTADSTDDLSFDKPDTGRKKRQAVFYIVLLVFVALVVASVWFVFLRQPENTGAPQPLPVAEADPQAGNDGALPPGISSASHEAAPITPVNNAGETASAPAPIPAPDMATTAPVSPAAPVSQETAPAPASANGTTVEALPPPPPVAQEVMPANSPPADMATATEPQALSPVLPEPVHQAPGTTTPAPEMTGTPPSPPAPVEAPHVTNAVMPAADATAPAAATTTADPAIQQRLSQIEEQIRTISSTAPAAATTNGQSDEALKAQLKALSDKLDNLATQVDSLDQRTTNFATELQNRGNDAPSMTASAPEAKSHPKPAAKKAPIKPRKAPSAKSKSASASWELRSAQPGVAWLGKPGSGEMSRFAIGQSVPGLGTVQDVSQEAGRWIVKTSGGTLRQ